MINVLVVVDDVLGLISPFRRIIYYLYISPAKRDKILEVSHEYACIHDMVAWEFLDGVSETSFWNVPKFLMSLENRRYKTLKTLFYISFDYVIRTYKSRCYFREISHRLA